MCFALRNEDFRQSVTLMSPQRAAEPCFGGVQSWVGTATSGFCSANEPTGGPASSLALASPWLLQLQLAPLQASCLLVCWDSRAAGLTSVPISEGKHVISGYARCHLEGSSGFPKWKQHALRVITGWEACSGVRPSTYKQRLPFQPGDRTIQGGRHQSQLNPGASQRVCTICSTGTSARILAPGFQWTLE